MRGLQRSFPSVLDLTSALELNTHFRSCKDQYYVEKQKIQISAFSNFQLPQPLVCRNINTALSKNSKDQGTNMSYCSFDFFTMVITDNSAIIVNSIVSHIHITKNQLYVKK